MLPQIIAISKTVISKWDQVYKVSHEGHETMLSYTVKKESMRIYKRSLVPEACEWILDYDCIDKK